MGSELVRSSLFIISDTHAGNNGQALSKTFSFRPPFPQADILLHTGDLTMYGRPAEHRAAFNFLKGIDAELKLVIAGNHELTLDKEWYLHAKTDRFKENKSNVIQATTIDPDFYDPKHPDEMIALWKSNEAREARIHFLDEGMHQFKLSNGAELSVYASPYQPEYFNWAFNYAPEEDRFNPPELVSTEPFVKDRSKTTRTPSELSVPIPSDKTVDIILTHGPPWKHLDRTSTGFLAGCPHLLTALDRVRPRLHCFGHIHEAWGAERVTWQPKDPKAAPLTNDPKQLGVKQELTETCGSQVLNGSGIQRIDDKAVVEYRAAYLDVSRTGDRPLQAGKETLLVNSSIMSLDYEPDNSAWLVHLDLPKVAA